jgi:hypothetical protein
VVEVARKAALTVVLMASCGDLVSPALQRSPHFLCIAGSIINPSNPCTMPADVIEDGFDYVRQHPKFGHLRCGCAPEVVQPPSWHSVKASIKVGLWIAPA